MIMNSAKSCYTQNIETQFKNIFKNKFKNIFKNQFNKRVNIKKWVMK